MRRIVFVLVCCLCFAVVACTPAGNSQPAPVVTSRATGSLATGAEGDDGSGAARQQPGATCTLSPKLVPSCGVLWGIDLPSSTAADFFAMGELVGRPFDIDYTYHDVNDVIPTAEEKEVVSRGAILHTSIAARDFGNPGAAVTWAQVARGEFDSTLFAQAQGIARLKVPVFVTFEQEASQKKKFGRLGDGADFRAAWRHLYRLYERAGAHNAVWVWVMTGGRDNLRNAARLWPGNKFVDWISWNVYNTSGCRNGRITLAKKVSFGEKMTIFYDWVHSQGPRLGIDTNKPMMISETGSALYAADPEVTADWYAKIPNVLERYPQIKAVQLWSSYTDMCDYRITNNAKVLQAVKEAGLSSWVDRLDVAGDRNHRSPTGGGS